MIQKINIALLLIIFTTLFLNINKLEMFQDADQNHVVNIEDRIRNLQNMINLIKKIKLQKEESVSSKSSLKLYSSCIKKPSDPVPGPEYRTSKSFKENLLLPNGNTLKLSQYNNISVKN